VAVVVVLVLAVIIIPVIQARRSATTRPVERDASSKFSAISV